jgi:hypothetical protein
MSHPEFFEHAFEKGRGAGGKAPWRGVPLNPDKGLRPFAIPLLRPPEIYGTFVSKIRDDSCVLVCKVVD